MKAFVSLHSAPSLAIALVAAAASLLLPPSVARAIHPTATKLHSRATADTALASFGQSVAVSDKWILVGEPLNDSVAPDAGAVHVFSALTGRYLRTLTGAETLTGDQFGASVALCGDIAAIGAPFDDTGAMNSGAIYLFDLRKGTQLRQVVPTVPIADQLYGLSVSLSGDQALVGAPQPATGNGRAYLVEVSTGIQLRVFTAADGAADDRFGHSVALCGRVAAIGAPQGDGAVADCGTVYVYDTKDGSFVSESDGSDAAAGDAFGESVALSDGYLVAGAPAKDSETGAAYVFSLNGGAELWKLEAADAATSHRFGNAVAASGALVLVGEHRWSLGAPNPGIGAASLFDLTSGGFVGRFLAGDFSNGDEFGTAVALCGSFALVGSPLDDDIDTDNGAAYFYRNVSSPAPFRALAKSGDSAIGIPEADYRTFGQPVMDFPGFPVFQSSLSGPGSNRNRDVGIWQDQAGTTLREIRTREDLSGVGAEYDAVTVSKILDLHGALGGATFTVSLAGSGVTSANNRAVLTTFFPNNVMEIARTGDSPPVLAGAEFSALLDASASGGGATFALPSRLRVNVGGATAADDSGVYLTNGTERFVREGETFGGSTLRQFFGRVATHGTITKLAFPAYHVPMGETAAVQGVFTMGHTAGGSDALIESQNTPQPDDPAQNFRAFLGEAASPSTYTLIRATLTGPGVTGANNEGLWRNNSGIVVDLVVREGTEPDPVNLPGVTISRILAYWADSERAVIHATLRGPGVTSANDGAVLLVNPGVETRVLLREGDPVCDWDCPKIASIQRVEFNRYNRRYAIVASLTGSKARNQALFAGHVVSAHPVRNLPLLRLRKGSLYQSPAGQTTRLRSIDLRPIVESTGSGANGRDQVAWTDAVLCLSFDNKVKQIATIGLLP